MTASTQDVAESGSWSVPRFLLTSIAFGLLGLVSWFVIVWVVLLSAWAGGFVQLPEDFVTQPVELEIVAGTCIAVAYLVLAVWISSRRWAAGGRWACLLAFTLTQLVVWAVANTSDVGKAYVIALCVAVTSALVFAAGALGDRIRQRKLSKQPD